MANKYHNSQTTPSQNKGKDAPKLPGAGTVPADKMGTANWPGLPGKAGKSRAAGTPTGDFYVKQEGL